MVAYTYKSSLGNIRPWLINYRKKKQNERIFASFTSDNGLISQICRKHNSKGKRVNLRKKTKDLSRKAPP